MHEHAGPPRWVGALFAVGLAAVVGTWTYHLGFTQGLATQLPASATGPYPWAIYRPWGFGPFFPLFFLFSWFVAIRVFTRGGRWRGGWGGYYYDRRGVPPMFEEWHRRVHEQEARPASPPSAQG
jgi:hypothetical protein